MRKAEHKSPGTHNPAAPAIENLTKPLHEKAEFVKL
jgi:hypothetical protein